MKCIFIWWNLRISNRLMVFNLPYQIEMAMLHNLASTFVINSKSRRIYSGLSVFLYAQQCMTSIDVHIASFYQSSKQFVERAKYIKIKWSQHRRPQDHRLNNMNRLIRLQGYNTFQFLELITFVWSYVYPKSLSELDYCICCELLSMPQCIEYNTLLFFFPPLLSPSPPSGQYIIVFIGFFFIISCTLLSCLLWKSRCVSAFFYCQKCAEFHQISFQTFYRISDAISQRISFW